MAEMAKDSGSAADNSPQISALEARALWARYGL